MAGQLGNTGLEKQHGSEFPGSSFCLLYPTLELGQAISLEMSVSTDNKTPQEKPTLSLSKGQGKGKPGKTVNF